MALNFLKGLALVEKKSEFLRGKRLKRQEVTEAIGHTLTLSLTFIAPAARSRGSIEDSRRTAR